MLYFPMSELLKRLRKNTIVTAEILKNSKYFCDEQFIKTNVPLLNVALSGRIDGGLPRSGIVQIAAPPKHFKSNFMIEIIKGFQAETVKDDAITVLYDSELGTTPAYFEKSGVDTTLIDHRPIKSVEELKADAANLLNDAKDGDNILIAVDSLGMLRSDKEAADALKNDVKVDMTRAKEIKSFFRIVTGEAVLKRIPMIVVNHSYQTLEMYSKEVAAGGRGAQYAANTLLFITKAQEVEKEDGKNVLLGFKFTLRAGLSRYVKENSLFPIIVRFGEGIYRYSGIFDLALELGYIDNPKMGWYLLKGEDKQRRRADIEEDEEIMETFLQNKEFCDKVEKKYAL
jgi:RecA/RadA recombinase